VDVAVVRPWRTPAARAPLAIGLAIGMAAWVLATGFFAFRQMMADGAWTGATITMGYVPAKAIVLSLIAYAAGRTFLSARAEGVPQHWALPAFLGLVIAYSLVTDALSLRAGALERHAADPALTAEDVTALAARVRAGDAGRDETAAFLKNPLCPPDLLAEFAGASDSLLRMAVASNHAIAVPLAEKLAGDEDGMVRYYLAFNRTLPVALLTRLAADSDERVREAVAWTPALPEADFNRLVEDASASVRTAAAWQPRLSPAQFERLRNDPEQRVRDAVTRWGWRTE
jgi:hypothetical protein